MVDFLKGRMFRRGLNLHQCVILAAYILFQAKEHADGCGGESHIAILRDNGVSGRVATDRITAITSLLELADNAAGRVLLDAADLEKDDAAFRSDLESIVEVMSRIRNAKRKEVAQARETWDAISKILGGGSEPPVLDEFGLPKRLDAQTSTGPQ